MSTKLNVILVSHAKKVLETGSRDRARMLAYASSVQSLNLVVFTLRSDNLPSHQTEGNLSIHGTDSKNKLMALWDAFKILKKLVASTPVDEGCVISSQDPFETALVARVATKKLNIPHQIQIHGDVFNPKSYTSSLLQRVRAMYGRYVVKRATCLRAVSDRIKESLVKTGVQPERITVLPIQADLQEFLLAGEKRQYNTQQPIKFLYVGRFSPEKNLTFLVQAFKEATKNHPDHTLTLVGDGPELEKITKQITQLDYGGAVKIESWTNDVPETMAQHDVFCLASSHEGWGMVTLEAAAVGLPIITTDVGGAGKTVQNDVNGRIVDTDSLDEYSKAFLKYLSEPELIEKERKASYQLAQSLFISEQEYVQKIVEGWSSCFR